ncbi:unnamed protein product [Fraxinus pennsylvanica]|uniref:Uncharacterized protein n=1 Tax=Fraxinus pennsylvanica TaxID=56036 RepID=A0AAD1ZJT8_9LAMI|nr:unnamed protein product [Fraxinus pennsylvanica]
MEERDIDDLPKNPANYTALTPLGFLERAALVHPTRKSVIHGSVSYTWQQTYRRCRRLASALTNRSVGFGDTVAVIAPNIPATFEAHFGVPMSGAVLNAVNIRLNAQTIAFLLGHSKSSVIMVDQDFFTLAEEALNILAKKNKGNFTLPLLIVIADENCDLKTLQYALGRGAMEYEKFLETGDPNFAWKPPQDEWHSIALGYTSGTTASPKGVVLHHRGAYLMALSNAIVWGMQEGAVYLWTLPMFHCNGWCFTWTLAALCGTSICLRQVTAKAVYSAVANLNVTHFCAAPVVLNTIVNAPKDEMILPLPRVVHVMTAGAAPPPSVLFAMSQLGFRVTHTYGLSETYGPSTICAWKPEWDSLPPETQALSENPRSCTDSAVLSPVAIGTSLQDSRKFGNGPLVSEKQRSCINSAAVSPVGTIHQVSRNAGNAPSVSKIRRVRANSATVSPIGTSHRDSRNFGNAPLVSEIRRTSSDSAALSPVGPSLQGTRSAEFFGDFNDTIASCDIFNGHWMIEEDFKPLYQPGSCPFVDDAFNCFKNGQPDSDYFKLRWKPHDCEIPRFDGITMLKMLRGKRMVFVGDSINRNMWEALVCALRESLDDKSKVFEASGRREFRSQGFYSFQFKDFECSIDFIRSPFLVQELKVADKAGKNRKTLRLDMMQDSCNEYRDADAIIFNTGHWWTHQKTFKGNYFFQEGDLVYDKLEVTEAYKRALRTWAQWVDSNINISRTSVFFRGYSASHFKGGQWNSGGNCDGETLPITNDAYLLPYPWMTKVQESVISEMKSPVFLSKHYKNDRLQKRWASLNIPAISFAEKAWNVSRLQPLVPPRGTRLLERASLCDYDQIPEIFLSS